MKILERLIHDYEADQLISYRSDINEETDVRFHYSLGLFNYKNKLLQSGASLSNKRSLVGYRYQLPEIDGEKLFPLVKKKCDKI